MKLPRAAWVKRMAKHRRVVLAGLCAGILSGIAAIYGWQMVRATGTNVNSGSGSHWAWNDAIGWIDFYSPGTVTVSSSGLSGYASSSVGQISLDCATSPSGNICGTSNYQVTNDGSGNLSGWAWNDNIGWISFDCHNNSGCGTSNYQVTIDSSGNFQGWAWNDAIGWIDFNCDNNFTCATSNYLVNSTWNSGPTSAVLDSTTYDTGDTSGAQLNSVQWKGTLGAGTTVEFQFAVSNSSSGPWNYTGPDGTANTYYVPTGPGVVTPLDYSLYNNYRYFRYRITLIATPTSTPVVSDVIVNWSP